MKITMVFKSRICTEETYPKFFTLEFACDVHDVENIFKEAHEFEELILTKMHPVDITTECLGYTEIREATSGEMLDLARTHIRRYEK